MFWLIPLLITVFIIAMLFASSKGGDYSLSGLIETFLILIVWLIYCVLRICFGIVKSIALKVSGRVYNIIDNNFQERDKYEQRINCGHARIYFTKRTKG
jgi:hypothetical protein